MLFNAFDPLEAKQVLKNEVAINAMKRELKNILDSYMGWYDPFSELIQNALDSVEEKALHSCKYQPIIRIIIDLQQNSLIVSDNGVGLTKEQYEQFLAPSFSFKSGNTRGHKGVGATYLAYGFNFIQISTKTDEFSATGRMLNARKWLSNPSPASNPKVRPDKGGALDTEFKNFDTGVSICVKFDNTTYPGDLSWLKATKAEQWLPILYVKTGLGSFFPNKNIRIKGKVIGMQGNETVKEQKGISYFWPHEITKKSASLKKLQETEKKLFSKKGKEFKMPASLLNLDAIYEFYKTSELKDLVSLSEEETVIFNKFSPCIYFAYMYSAKTWSMFNEKLQIRQGATVLSPGIQIAANNMPQGEMIQVPLKRNIGRQNQVHLIFHFNNCNADLGRKGFQKEIVEFCTDVSKKIIDGPIQKMRHTLRPVTGVKEDLIRETGIDTWKEEMSKHERENPLELIDENFFIPTKRISITSIPTREQDIIALFNQLIAGGVIRGIKIMATNERFAYDGMYRVVFEKPSENFIYNETSNPLGVLTEYVTNAGETFRSSPKILEYKFSLDALIEDIENGDKNSNDISLVVVWKTEEDYKGHYHITSLLDVDNLAERQYHGITHILTNISTGQKEMDLIVLEELIQHLKDPKASIKYQKEKYEQNY